MQAEKSIVKRIFLITFLINFRGKSLPILLSVCAVLCRSDPDWSSYSSQYISPSGWAASSASLPISRCSFPIYTYQFVVTLVLAIWPAHLHFWTQISLPSLQPFTRFQCFADDLSKKYPTSSFSVFSCIRTVYITVCLSGNTCEHCIWEQTVHKYWVLPCWCSWVHRLLS